MEIPTKLLRFKFHILFTVALFLSPDSLPPLHSTELPRCPCLLWPFLVSTALFLVAVTVFGQTSPPASGEKASEGLLDFIAGQPKQVEIADESSKTSN
ncbi:hypothetical protein NMG60_11017280 [Bertholletia excelsa]